MNVIFLDIDGVLNGYETAEQSPEGFTGIDDEKVALLAEIAQLFHAEIVLSSDWRLSFNKDRDTKYLLEKLNKYGLKITDFTPNISSQLRGAEISVWLDQHKEVEQYVVLDDNKFDFSMCGELYHHWIETSTDGVYKIPGGIFSSHVSSRNPAKEVSKIMRHIQSKKNEKEYDFTHE